MTKYREILWIRSIGFSDRTITSTCHVSSNTRVKVVKTSKKQMKCISHGLWKTRNWQMQI